MGWDGGDAAGLTRTYPANRPRSARPPETVRDSRDARRMAHNPEVEGSNPSPATKARGPFSNRERAFRLWLANGYVNVAFVMGCPSGPQHGTYGYGTL